MRFALFSLLACALAVTPVDAQKSQDFWHLSNFTNPKTQRFEYCAVESGFDNGLSLAFARNRDYLTNIIVGFSEPKLEEKTKYKLLVDIDGHAPTEITGFAADPKALVIPLQKDKKLLEELRAGNLLEIKGPQDAIKFSLNGAAQAFGQLQECIDKSLKEETHKTPAPISEPAKRALTVLSQAAPTPGGSLAGVEEVEPLPLPKEPAPKLEMPVPTKPIEPPAAIIPAPVASTEPVSPHPVVEPKIVDTVPTPSRLPVQSASLDSGKQAAPVVPPTPPETVQPSPPTAPAPKGLESAPYDQIVVVPDKPAVPPANTTNSSMAPVVPNVTTAVAAPPVLAATPLPQPAPASPPAPVPTIVRPSPPHAFSSLALPAILAELGLDAKKEKGTAKNSEKFYWHQGDLAGTATETGASKPFLDEMLAAVDAMEKSCKMIFSSDLGAPNQKAGLVYAEAIIGCGSGSTAIQGAVLFYQIQGKFVVFTEQGQPVSRTNALQQRENLKNNLLLSTNYK